MSTTMEARAKSDGDHDEKERARIAAAQDRAARHIARENTIVRVSGIDNSKRCEG